MSVKNYRFVSPGVFVNEIDNSQTPASPAGIGPVVIGRAEKGPALRPITVDSFEEFVNVFGTPTPGGTGGDVWRTGNNTTATTYGMYAAQAYLRNSSPLTYIRLLGAEDSTVSGVGGAAEAGWQLTSGRAYGLVLFQTASAGLELTGALAGIVYTQGGYEVQLSGTAVSASIANNKIETATIGVTALTGSDVVVLSSNNAAKEFKTIITDGSTSETITFNFNKSDSRYVRKVLNTNPQLLNSGITDAANLKNYFLGETFDRHVTNTLTDANSAILGAFIRLESAGTNTLSGDDFQYNLIAPQTPNVVSCRLSPTDEPTTLFKFVARGESGDWLNKNIKISIQDIKRSSNNETDYGSFSVVIRHLSDSDNVVKVVEQFNNCNLNPDSLNYIARKIGDSRLTWDTTERRYIEAGSYRNNSQYVYVDVASDVDGGLTNPALIPFGFEGIIKYQNESFSSVATRQANWISGSNTDVLSSYTTGAPFIVSGSAVTASVAYPAPILRVNASDGNLNNPTDAYFGFQTSDAVGSTAFDKSTIDLLRPRGGIVGAFGPVSDDFYDRTVRFSLDDISGSGVYVSGSSATTSLTFVNGAVSGVLDAGYDRFTLPIFGGFDGTDITEMDPFSSARMPSSPSDTTSYSFYSVRRSVDAMADPEVVQMNLATIPGQTQEGLTTHLVRTCEDRADALAVIDLPSAFQPREDGKSVARLNTQSTVTTLVNGLRDRALNSSYGCAFYPWVRARDTINGSFVWLPPSVAALGTFSSSQRRTQVWFAPAGFNRGGLTEGAAGIPVVDVAHHLRRKDRDDLYTANINPIAKFPAEGIVIFGQKTLQVTPSALDRINVRRMMIFVKKRISQIAAGLLFDPNVQQTWKRFLAKVNPFLADVKTNFGLSDYKIILDETTTTPDLIDRNVLYAQIFLKPTRGIEYIAIDFNISRTGASFSD